MTDRNTCEGFWLTMAVTLLLLGLALLLGGCASQRTMEAQINPAMVAAPVQPETFAAAPAVEPVIPPAQFKGVMFDYPSNLVDRVVFWLETSTNFSDWSVVAVMPTTNLFTTTQPNQFVRVGVRWK